MMTVVVVGPCPLGKELVRINITVMVLMVVTMVIMMVMIDVSVFVIALERKEIAFMFH